MALDPDRKTSWVHAPSYDCQVSIEEGIHRTRSSGLHMNVDDLLGVRGHWGADASWWLWPESHISAVNTCGIRRWQRSSSSLAFWSSSVLDLPAAVIFFLTFISLSGVSILQFAIATTTPYYLIMDMLSRFTRTIQFLTPVWSCAVRPHCLALWNVLEHSSPYIIHEDFLRRPRVIRWRYIWYSFCREQIRNKRKSDSHTICILYVNSRYILIYMYNLVTEKEKKTLDS